MNTFFENLQNNITPNLSKEIQKQPINNNIINIFTNTKTNNNYINNNYYFYINKNQSNKKEPQNYIYIVNNDNISHLSQKPKNVHNSIKNMNEKIKNNKKESFDSSKENKNIKNMKLSEDLSINNEKKNQNIMNTLSELKKFKTELCHSWEITGTCKYGQNVIYIIYNININFILQCVFAHGEVDLRTPLKEEKKYSYKTKLCKQFFTDGYCPYGKRCQFSHQKQNISYIDILKQIIKNKKISKKLIKTPRLDVFQNITKL